MAAMPFADELISTWTAQNLTHAVRAARPQAELSHLTAAAEGLTSLSLRQRSDLLRDALLADVPGGYPELAATIRAARESARVFEGWMIWPITTALADRAVRDGGAEAFDDAMRLLAELTGLLTSEFALRTLLRHDLGRALAIIQDWTRSPDVDVRRLASEGTRPYLPWAVRVPEILARPGITTPILDALYRDQSQYVRRSVANHLNDLSRDAPALSVATAGRWLAEPDASTAGVVRRSLRTLVKKGDPQALALQGYSPPTEAIKVEGPFIEDDVVAFGGSVRFAARISNTGVTRERLAIDYVVHHQRLRGAPATKTFKLTTVWLEAGKTLEVRREHSLRPLTTRRYYPGAHAVALQINGTTTEPAHFDLLAPPAENA
jgi:3-methyladenine DNA glycosylase AlkC